MLDAHDTIFPGTKWQVTHVSEHLNCFIPVPGRSMAFSKIPNAVSYDPALYCSRPTCRFSLLPTVSSHRPLGSIFAGLLIIKLTAIAPRASSGSGMSNTSVSSDSSALILCSLVRCTRLCFRKGRMFGRFLSNKGRWVQHGPAAEVEHVSIRPIIAVHCTRDDCSAVINTTMTS